MRAQVILLVAFVGAFCAIHVSAQVKQGAAAPADSEAPTVPPAVEESVKKLQADVQQMKSSGNIDQSKIIQDVQEIVDAAKSSNPAPAAQAQIKTIQTSLDQMKSSGKADPQQISTMIQSIYALNGAKPAGKPGKGPIKLG